MPSPEAVIATLKKLSGTEKLLALREIKCTAYASLLLPGTAEPQRWADDRVPTTGVKEEAHR